MLEKFSNGNQVRDSIATVAGPRSWSDTRESWLARAARRAGISYRTTKSLWYGQISNPHHPSARLMRDAAQKYEAIAAQLPESLCSEEIAAILDLARTLRNRDSSF